MGLFDDVLGAVAGNQQGGAAVGATAGGGGSPLQGALRSMLGGGGVGGLLSQFEQAGLGSVVQSWVGHGQNQPISPEQVGQALGPQQVQDMAAQSGLQPQEVLEHLAQMLPSLVDRMTPGGQPPPQDTMTL